MATSSPTRQQRSRSVRTANDRLKADYSARVARSIFAAAVLHAVIFIGVPSYDLTREGREPRTVTLLLPPILALEDMIDPGAGALSDRPGEERMELPLENSAPDGLAVDSGDRVEAAGGPVPALAYPVMATYTDGPAPHAIRSNRMILEPMKAVRPDLAPTGPAMTWPLIRNPTAILRFLKSRYNPVHSPSPTNRFVAVAMGINERGGVEWTEVQESSGHPIVDEIALRVFNEVVVFSPARSEGAPIAVSVIISIPFDMPW